MSNFRKALLWTALPTVLLGIISTIGLAATETNEVGNGFNIVWFVALGILAIEMLLGFIMLFFPKNRQIAAGIWAGIALGIVTLGVTCFANAGAIGS
jgi:hypothetical protein